VRDHPDRDRPDRARVGDRAAAGVRGVAGLVARRAGPVTLRLAAARLACGPAGTVRIASGVAVAAFLVTGGVGVLAAFQSEPMYVQDRHAYEQRPQRHWLEGS